MEEYPLEYVVDVSESVTIVIIIIIINLYYLLLRF